MASKLRKALNKDLMDKLNAIINESIKPEVIKQT